MNLLSRRSMAMLKIAVAVLFAGVLGVAEAETIFDGEVLTADQIASRGARPLTKEEVLKLVSGANVQWSAFGGGERLWTNEPGGQFWGTRIGTGVGSFNPHHKASRGKWEVRDDGAYCVSLDYGHMMVENFCLFFSKDESNTLLRIEPSSPGSRIRLSR